MIRFSCSDYTFPLLGRRESFQVIHTLGFKFADLGLFARSPQLSPVALAADPAGFLRSLKQDLQDAELGVADLFLQIGPSPAESSANDPSAAVREQNREAFLQALQLCAELGCEHLTGLPGVLHPASNPQSDLGLAVDESVWRADSAAKLGIVYAIEPHTGSICNDVAQTLEFVRQAQGVSLTLDYGHFVMQGETSESIHRLLPYATHFHARGGAPGKLQCSVSENVIDFKTALQELEKGRAKFVALEYVWVDWEGCNRVDNISETLLLRRELSSYLAKKAG